MAGGKDIYENILQFPIKTKKLLKSEIAWINTLNEFSLK